MFSRKNKTTLVLLMLVLVLVLASCGGGGGTTNEGGEKKDGGSKFMSVATGGTGGAYYPLGGSLATILNDSDMGVQATAQATGASVENIELIHKGDAEIAFSQNDTAYYASQGVELFGEQKDDNGKVTQEQRVYDDIRGLCTLYPEVVQIITPAGSGIESVADMAGKKIAVGAPGSGTEVCARQILELYGLEYKDLGKADYLSFSEATDQIKNNQIDAAFVVAAIPSSSVSELATTNDVRLVGIEEAKANELAEKYPYYTFVQIAPDSYKGQAEEVPAVAVQAMLIVNKSMSDDDAYNIVKNLFEHLDVVIASHARGKDITLDTALNGMSIELHPGAQKYFDEKGIK